MTFVGTSCNIFSIFLVNLKLLKNKILKRKEDTSQNLLQTMGGTCEWGTDPDKIDRELIMLKPSDEYKGLPVF